MTDLAVRLLPHGVARVAGEVPPVDVHLVLTGAGGGTWDVALGERVAAAAVPEVAIVADAVGFCRLVADRIGRGRARRARDRGDRARGHRPRRCRRARARLRPASSPVHAGGRVTPKPRTARRSSTGPGRSRSRTRAALAASRSASRAA